MQRVLTIVQMLDIPLKLKNSNKMPRRDESAIRPMQKPFPNTPSRHPGANHAPVNSAEAYITIRWPKMPWGRKRQC